MLFSFSRLGTLRAIASRQRRRLQLHEQGSSLVEMAVITPVLVLVLVAAVDFGQAYYAALSVESAAHAGALYGAQYPTDTVGITAAAALDAPSNLMTTAVKIGCECFDGTGASDSCVTVPSCSMNIVNYVDVTTTLTYSSLLTYPGIPSSLVLKGRSRLRAAH